MKTKLKDRIDEFPHSKYNIKATEKDLEISSNLIVEEMFSQRKEDYNKLVNIIKTYDNAKTFTTYKELANIIHDMINSNEYKVQGNEALLIVSGLFYYTFKKDRG